MCCGQISGGTLMSNRGESQLVRLQQEERHQQPAAVAELVEIRTGSSREQSMVDRRRKEQRTTLFRFKHLLPLQNSVRGKVFAIPSGDKRSCTDLQCILALEILEFLGCCSLSPPPSQHRQRAEKSNTHPVLRYAEFPVKGDWSEAPPTAGAVHQAQPLLRFGFSFALPFSAW